jgi:hypothetical protein
MPLIKSKSKEAFAKNVKTELSAGRPMKQSLAIAYSTKRAAGSHHSAHSQRRSDHYHSEVVEGTAIDRGATKMTRQAATRGKNEEAWDR